MAKITKKVKRRKEKKPIPVEETVRVFHPIPAFRRIPDQPDFAALSISISEQVKLLLAGYVSTAVKFAQDKAQEDEEDLELLLLSI